MAGSKLKILCPVCKEYKYVKTAGSVSSLYSVRPYALASCQNCGHMFNSEPADKEELDALYNETYNYESHRAIENEKKWRIHKTISSIKSSLPANTAIIDIGCMYGFALEAFRSMGYSDLLGIEIGKAAIKECRGKGFDVFEGTFSDWLNSGSFRSDKGRTIIYMSHVIEHLPDLDGFFAEINKVLHAGDYLVVMVPNSKSRTVTLLKKYWGWWQVPVHVHHFSIKSLTRLLSASNFVSVLTLKRGADSLFWLSSLASLMGMKSESNTLTLVQRSIIRICSVIAKYWYYWGDEELVVVSRKE
jgi:SAM-dependent methyltransferase